MSELPPDWRNKQDVHRLGGNFTQDEILRAKTAPDAEIVDPASPQAGAATTPVEKAPKTTSVNTGEIKPDVALSGAEGVFAEKLLKDFNARYFEIAGTLRKRGLEPNDVAGWSDVVLLRQNFLTKKGELETSPRRDKNPERTEAELRDSMLNDYQMLGDVAMNKVYESMRAMVREREELQAAGAQGQVSGDMPAQDISAAPEKKTESTDTPAESGQRRAPKFERDELQAAVNELYAATPSNLDSQSADSDLIPAAAPDVSPNKDAIVLDMKTAEGRAEKLGLLRAREALLESEKLLIEKEKEFVKNHSKLGRAVQALFGTKKVQELQSLEAEVNRRAGQYHSGIEQKLVERLQKKGYVFSDDQAYKGAAGEGRVRTEELITRYRERVEARDVVERGEDRRQSAREGAIGEKSPLAYEKLASYLGSVNHSLEERLGGKTKARIIRLAAVGSLSGIVGVATGGLAFGAILASSKVGRGALGWALGSGAGAGAGLIYESMGGAYARAGLKEARGSFSAGSEKVQDLRKKYRSGTEEAIARKRAKWETYTQLLTAAAIGASGNVFSHEALMHAVGAPDASVPPEVHEATPIPSMTPDAAPVPNAGAVDAVPEPPQVPHVDVDFSVHAAPGDGYERMLGKLADAAKGHATADQFPPGSDAYRLLSADPHARAGLLDELAKKHAMLHTDGRSGIVGLSDSVRFDASGNVHLVGPGHPDFVDAPQNYPTTPALHTVDHVVAAHAGPPSALETQATAERLQAWHAAHPGLDAVAPNVDAAGAVHDPSDVLAHDAVQAPSAPSPESFVNAHAVTIDPKIPRVYGAADGKLYAYGGTYTDRLAVATTHVEAHGGRVLIEAEKPALVDGRPHRYFVEVRKPRLFGLWQGARTEPLPVVSDAERYLNQSNAAFTSQFTSTP